MPQNNALIFSSGHYYIFSDAKIGLMISTPEYGAPVRWIDVLMDIELESDKAFRRNSCGELETV
jgi:hypothetical protein